MTLKALQDCFALSQNVRLYVPSTLNGQDKAPAQKVDRAVQDTLKRFSQWFGGATAYTALGAWFSQDRGKVITEQVVIVESFTTPEAVDNHLAQVVEWAETIKEQFAQESVAVEHDHTLYLV